MTNERKMALCQEATFIQTEDGFFRMDACSDEGIYFHDEEHGEEYFMTYEELDLDNPEVLLYALQLINTQEQ